MNWGIHDRRGMITLKRMKNKIFKALNSCREKICFNTVLKLMF